MPRSKITISDDKRAWNKLNTELYLMSRGQGSVIVGILEKEGEQLKKVRNQKDEIAARLVDIAAMHEFGLGHSPKRSFIREPFD